jgi:hypothetical protein
MSKTAFNVNRGIRLRQQASLPGDADGGLIVHQDNKIWAYIDGGWVDLGSGGGSGGLARTTVDDTDSPIAAEIAKWYVTDTTNGTITINMPDLTAIAPGDLALAVMRFSDCSETWGVNNVVLVPFSGQSIDGQAADEPFLLDVSAQTCWAIMESTSNWCIDTTFQPTESTDNTIKNDITSPAYNFMSGDLNTVMQLSENTANNITMTIPSGLGNAGDTLTVIQMGTGVLSWSAGGGVTLNAAGGLTDMSGQYSVCTAIQTSPNVWVLTGDRV